MKTFLVRRCCDCDGEVREQFHGDEGWSICEGCGNVEQPTYERLEDQNGNPVEEPS